jgi:hypothetical protein
MSNRGRYGGGRYVSQYKTLILGSVLLWGTVLRGDLVIRAQYARPIAFTTLPEKERTVPDWQEMADVVSQTYSVPIVDFRHLTMFSSEFGDLAGK